MTCAGCGFPAEDLRDLADHKREGCPTAIGTGARLEQRARARGRGDDHGQDDTVAGRAHRRDVENARAKQRGMKPKKNMWSE